MLQLMRHVGEERPLWPQLPRDGDCFVETEMSGMRPRAKRVENQHVESFELRLTGLGNQIRVGAVSHIAEAEAKHPEPPVGQANGNNSLPEHRERLGRDSLEDELRHASAIMWCIGGKSVVQRSANPRLDEDLSVRRQAPAEKIIEAPH